MELFFEVALANHARRVMILFPSRLISELYAVTI